MSKLALDKFSKLPKIELHAHLSGSVRYHTIIDLLNEELNALDSAEPQKIKSEIDLLNCLKNKPSISCTNSRSLSECFQVFTILHRLLNNLNILEKVTHDILQDFESDNCVYLELRTTPRNIYDQNRTKILVSKRHYLKKIINVLENFERCHKMRVRLLLSVDRAKGVQDGLENVLLANELESKYIVGIDFSGNPHVNSFQDFEQIFNICKENGLKTTVHIAEIWNDRDKDFILKKIRPDRIGHSVCLDQEEVEYLIQNPIPIEICPTSNLVTKCVHQIDKHPFFDFYSKNKNYPLTICTDDCGIFDITLSKEYELISEAFKLSHEQMFYLSKTKMNFTEILRWCNDYSASDAQGFDPFCPLPVSNPPLDRYRDSNMDGPKFLEPILVF
ncbi:adenosine deaminase [Brachionus plicatilis]|uniref:Adenosine deaminase n=1 Tax=Brachionus plicatilis TaxID=10195 RepID=A0A3M7SZX4_BRAPC|nr:adenosine deaminase [Brachionus plicatilis]